MHLSICTPGATVGIYLSFDNALVPRGGYLIREQTRATCRKECRLYRLCAVFQTPDPIASVLLQAPENKKARVSRVVYRSVLAIGHGGACLYKL